MRLRKLGILRVVVGSCPSIAVRVSSTFACIDHPLTWSLFVVPIETFTASGLWPARPDAVGRETLPQAGRGTSRRVTTVARIFPFGGKQ